MAYSPEWSPMATKVKGEAQRTLEGYSCVHCSAGYWRCSESLTSACYTESIDVHEPPRFHQHQLCFLHVGDGHVCAAASVRFPLVSNVQLLGQLIEHCHAHIMTGSSQPIISQPCHLQRGPATAVTRTLSISASKQTVSLAPALVV